MGRADFRVSDTYYSTQELVITPKPDGSGHRWNLPDPVPAPWDNGEPGPPTYVFAHGTPEGKTMVRIRTDDGNTADLLVDGGSFGRILTANDHYRRAIDENSPTTVSSICYGDASANEMTAELWKAGIDTDVYAFNPQPIVGPSGTKPVSMHQLYPL
ncbi:hypothetical protein ACWCPQ_01110 [Nocardia sp. NPDC001965]